MNGSNWPASERLPSWDSLMRLHAALCDAARGGDYPELLELANLALAIAAQALETLGEPEMVAQLGAHNVEVLRDWAEDWARIMTLIRNDALGMPRLQ